MVELEKKSFIGNHDNYFCTVKLLYVNGDTNDHVRFFVLPALVHMSNMLTVEFMHYVIAARCLKKVFISVKGYYYQADIMGQTVTWIVPHPLALLVEYTVKLLDDNCFQLYR